MFGLFLISVFALKAGHTLEQNGALQLDPFKFDKTKAQIVYEYKLNN